jgi:flagellar basal-body rod protein FlgB
MALFDHIGQLRSSLDYHLARQNLLTANLAHADTPGYKPVDLERGTFRDAMRVALSATNEGHIQPHDQTGEGFRVVHDPSVADGLDGNGVSLDREAVKLAANQVRYDTVAALASSELAGLAWAANDGKNG